MPERRHDCRRGTRGRVRHILLPLFFIAVVSASVPVRDACGEDASVVANVPDDAVIQIRHGVMGETVPCYAVSVGEVRGFILGTTLPVIQEFETKRALESRVPLQALPPPDTAKKATFPPLPVPPFETWSGASTSGKRMQIAPGGAPVTLVTFWSAQSGTARKFVEHLESTGSQYAAKGMKSFGMVQAPNTGRANYYLEDMGLSSPQALDTQRLAAKYNADPSKGTTLVLDGSNRIVMVSSNLAEIRAAVESLLAP